MWRKLIQSLEPQATFFPGATPSELTALEKEIGISLPEELQEMLQESNCVFGAYGLRLIWSIEDIRRTHRAMREGPFVTDYMSFENLLFFADAGNGDQFAFCMVPRSLRRPDIFVWNHENDSRTWVAPSLKLYLEWWLSGKLSI